MRPPSHLAEAITAQPACLVDTPISLSSSVLNATALNLAFALSSAVESATLYAGVVARPLLPSGVLAAPLVTAPLPPGAASYTLDLAAVGGGSIPVYWQVVVRGCVNTQMVASDVQLAVSPV